MASAKTRIKDDGSIVTDIFYAGLGAAALATDEAEIVLGRLGKQGRKVTRRIGDISEDLGDVVGEAIPEAVSEPILKFARDTRKGTSKAVKKAGKTLSKRGERTWKNLSKRLAGLGSAVENGLQPLLRGLGVASRKDLARIDARLDEISKALARLERRR